MSYPVDDTDDDRKPKTNFNDRHNAQAMNKKSALVSWLCVAGMIFPAATLFTQPSSGIKLIVRSDDMGFCHAVNEACIEVYREGISRSVEVLAPSPWFMEAVKMLQANPGFDVGVHLCLTSEWENVKWRPLTHVPSLTDANGYFPQFIWENKNSPGSAYLLERPVVVGEVEKELRAQIELVRKHLPQVSHLSAHMGSNRASPEVTALVDRLAKEYQLPIELPRDVQYIRGFGGAEKSPRQKSRELAQILDTLAAGTYCLVEHPGFNNEEMTNIFHKGYEKVGYDREGVTGAFTSRKVKKVISRKGIQLISIKEVLKKG